jgi:hypothetical protein
MNEPKWGAAGDPKFLLAMGDRQFGALIAQRINAATGALGFKVYVGRRVSWMQSDDTLAQADFDTLEEAMAFGTLIYTQQRNNI